MEEFGDFLLLQPGAARETPRDDALPQEIGDMLFLGAILHIPLPFRKCAVRQAGRAAADRPIRGWFRLYLPSP
jgi:hypothetical protein